jgi:uncharacterized protein (TIGR03435 family)
MARFLGLLLDLLLVIAFGAAWGLPQSRVAQEAAGAEPAAEPRFDLVAIRPMREGDNTPTHITNSAHNGSIRAVNVNVRALLEVAYDVPDLRMYGGPDWLSTEKFDLEAKADPSVDQRIAGLPPDEGKQMKRKMLAVLLAERFKIVVHTATKEMPVYALVIAKGGSKLGGANAAPGGVVSGEDRITIRPGHDSLEILAYELSWRLGRPVLDRTGLAYRQGLTLGWQDSDVISEDSGEPSLFTAIQEQLGLKLEAMRGQVRVLVIDHAEEPSEN